MQRPGAKSQSGEYLNKNHKVRKIRVKSQLHFNVGENQTSFILNCQSTLKIELTIYTTFLFFHLYINFKSNLKNIQIYIYTTNLYIWFLCAIEVYKYISVTCF
jgi:hypothetical protein